jgi:hypothetical protein
MSIWLMSCSGLTSILPSTCISSPRASGNSTLLPILYALTSITSVNNTDQQPLTADQRPLTGQQHKSMCCNGSIPIPPSRSISSRRACESNTSPIIRSARISTAFVNNAD